MNTVPDTSGTLTPFVARYLGEGSQAGDHYEILAIGDPLTVTSSDNTLGVSEGDHLENRAFTVSSVNPTIRVNSGDRIVAGWFQDGKIVFQASTNQGEADYVANGDTLSGATVGGALTSDSNYAFDRRMAFNIGFDLPAKPHPTVTISKPTAGATFAEGDSISFDATVNDEQDDDATLESALVWTSDLETDPIGKGASYSTNHLKVGTHTITATSSDSDLDVGMDTISLRVTSWNLGAIWYIGDSITQSNADGDPNGSPRKSLYELLMADQVGFTFTGHGNHNIDGLPDTGSTATSNLYQYHSGISGSVIGDNITGRAGMTERTPGFWTTGRLAAVKPNIVLIMLGTNDIDVGVDIINAPNRINTLVDTISAQLEPEDPKPAFFIAQITPHRGAESKRQDVIDFNNALPAIVATLKAEGKDVTLVDQYSRIFENSSELMRDNLHVNAAGNDVLAEQWYNALLERLGPAVAGPKAWQIKHFGTPCAEQAALNQDPDFDNLNNLLEYALGKDPNASDNFSSDLTTDVITFHKGEGVDDDLIYTILESVDLGVSDPWEAVVPDINDTNEITYQLRKDLMAHFFRLKVTQAN